MEKRMRNHAMRRSDRIVPTQHLSTKGSGDIFFINDEPQGRCAMTRMFGTPIGRKFFRPQFSSGYPIDPASQETISIL